jgi:transposase
VVAYNFFEFQRDQQFLLPENMLDWLPEGDLAHFVIEVVDNLDISEFLLRYRTDGWGAAAYHPRMMVALMVYSYCVGERSSRRVEKLCQRDVGFRVITGNTVPDHTTIARFRKESDGALSNLFDQVLALCSRAEMVKPSTLAIDGTKIKANASIDANRSHNSLKKEYGGLARRILDEAARVDEEEDRLYGPDNNPFVNELPEHLRNGEKRRAWIEEMLGEINREADEAAAGQQEKIDKREERRKAGEKHLGRNPLSTDTVRERFLEKAKVNTTDPESRIMKSSKGYVQGFNAQAAVTEDQVIVAAHLTDQEADWHLLHPMVELSIENLERAGEEKPVESVLADAGYGSRENLEEVERLKKESAEEEGSPCPDFFVATRKDRILAAELKESAVLDNDSIEGDTATERMEQKLKTKEGREAFAKRGRTVEPVFGQMKDCRRLERFMRRGLKACRAEWSLMCTTHNILKYWRFQAAAAANG